MCIRMKLNNWISNFKAIEDWFSKFNWQTDSLIEIDNVVNGGRKERNVNEIFMQFSSGVNRHNFVTRWNFIRLCVDVKSFSFFAETATSLRINVFTWKKHKFLRQILSDILGILWAKEKSFRSCSSQKQQKLFLSRLCASTTRCSPCVPSKENLFQGFSAFRSDSPAQHASSSKSLLPKAPRLPEES